MAQTTFDPAKKSAVVTLSSLNSVATNTAAGSWGGVFATNGIDASSPGGRYFEIHLSAAITTGYGMIGIAKSSVTVSAPYTQTGSVFYYATDGSKYVNGSNSAHGSAWGTAATIIGVVLKNGKVYFLKDNVLQNSANIAAETGFAASGLTGIFFPAITLYSAGTWTIKARSADFTYAPPTGVGAWDNSLSLSVPLVSKSGVPRASLALQWALFEDTSPVNLGAPDRAGEATTDASGILTIAYEVTNIATGGASGLLISTTDGTAGVQCMSAFLPVEPTVT